MSALPLVRLEEVTTFYGKSQALFGIDLEIARGEVATLLGRNGMGKTTTIKTIVGLLKPQSGTVSFLGESVNGYTADHIARRGIALAPEGRQVFATLSVEENLVAFAENRNNSADPWTLPRIYRLFPRLQERRQNLGSQLSGGEQQMLAIGRALMTNPHLLILDEATEGLAPLIREEIWDCLRALKAAGQTILLIDKYIEHLIEIGDHHTILERGRVAWQGNSDRLRADPAIWHRYLGV
jgi:branched-chain amino acid transport system ATP-binding protein